MTSAVKISAIRVYPPSWIVCELQIDGQPQLVRHTDHPDASQNWCSLFGAAETEQRDFSIDSGGDAVCWRQLGVTFTAEELAKGTPRFAYRWKRKRMTTAIAKEQIVDCWSNLESFRLVDLRPDGTCAQRMQAKGGASHDMLGEFSWAFESPERFHISHRLATPIDATDVLLKMRTAAGNNSQSPIERLTYTYDVELFDGEVMELAQTFDNGIGIDGPMPVWWRKWKHPKDRKHLSKANDRSI